MLALEIEFLTGRYFATAFNDRRATEWPPHPARVFSALVAALQELDGDPATAHEALDRLAALEPPEIWASDAEARAVLNHYVPVNDTKALGDVDRLLLELEEKTSLAAEADAASRAKADKAVSAATKKLRQRSRATSAASAKGGTPGNAAELLAEHRNKQPRTFPTCVPHDPVVHLVWNDATLQPGDIQALDEVASRVARLGHSASLVRMRIRDAAPELGSRRRWEPLPNGELVLRVPLEDQRSWLDREHARHRQVEPRQLPYRAERYGERTSSPQRTVTGSAFDARRWTVYRVVAEGPSGKRRLVSASRAEDLARAFRGAFLSVAGELSEVLNGHDSSGASSERPHLAIVPLPDVGRRWATGSILGLAVIPPADCSAEDELSLLSSLARLDDPVALHLSRQVCIHVAREVDVSTVRTLQASRWTRASRRWSTATPIALDRNPGDLTARDPEILDRAVLAAEASIAQSCRYVNLPPPSAVLVHRRSLLEGAPAARRFMPFPRARDKGHRRVCVHAEIVFPTEVRGPVIIGAGRYVGLGLMLPAPEGEA